MLSQPAVTVDPPALPRPPVAPWLRALRVVGGALLLLAGIAMLVLPGPGVAVMVGGLFVLGDEVAWARTLRVRLLAMVQRLRGAR